MLSSFSIVSHFSFGWVLKTEILSINHRSKKMLYVICCLVRARENCIRDPGKNYKMQIAIIRAVTLWLQRAKKAHNISKQANLNDFSHRINHFEWNDIITTTDHDLVTKAIGIRGKKRKHQLSRGIHSFAHISFVDAFSLCFHIFCRFIRDGGASVRSRGWIEK